jgi:Family of unknown function (DUF6516)
LTSALLVGKITNMKATLLIRERLPFGEDAFAELVLWKLAKPLPGSMHLYKYRLAFVIRDECVLRYDNEAGKGDRRHLRGRESAFDFQSPEQMTQAFLREARRIYREDSRS